MKKGMLFGLSHREKRVKKINLLHFPVFTYIYSPSSSLFNNVMIYQILVYTWSWTITKPEFCLASQPWTIRNSPWLTKMKKNKMAENFCFASVCAEFRKNRTSQEPKRLQNRA